MDDSRAQDLVREVFKEIGEAESIQDLQGVLDKCKIPKKNAMDSVTFPEILFDIQPEEIQSLVARGMLTSDLDFSGNISEKITDPLTKLLYATVWKNGDIKKIKRIIQGVVPQKGGENRREEALVFTQFGKYLTKRGGEPIVDQHVIRAFAMYQGSDDISQYRKMELLKNEHGPLIQAYKDWLRSDELTEKLRATAGYVYHIDQLLFAVGKTVKMKKEKV